MFFYRSAYKIYGGTANYPVWLCPLLSSFQNQRIIDHITDFVSIRAMRVATAGIRGASTQPPPSFLAKHIGHGIFRTFICLVLVNINPASMSCFLIGTVGEQACNSLRQFRQVQTTAMITTIRNTPERSRTFTGGATKFCQSKHGRKAMTEN